MAENGKRLIDYRETRKLFDEQYKQTKRLIQEGETHLDNLAEGFSEADHIIRDLPDVDAVEVVRCKDCKCFDGQEICDRHGFFVGLNIDTFYCADGERRTL